MASGRGKYWLSIGTTAALATLLTACGDHAGATIPTVNAVSATFSHHQTFRFTGKPQRFKVPHVQLLQVVVRGAGGAGTSSDLARGGRVYALIPASIDRELVVYVGATGNLTKGGYNGGADGGPDGNCSSCDGYGGGGASDIRLAGGTLGERVIVAGGGGGSGGGHSGQYSGGAGGGGGGGTGGSGRAGSGSSYSYCAGKGGDGGSQNAGGSGGSGCGYNGDGGSVGDGGTGGAPYYPGSGGGGGGGGFYGGGGGGAGAAGYSSYNGSGGGGGGGGGSSYVGKRATHFHVWRGWNNAVGNGLVVISW
jgi:hypothetical protein